MCNAEGMLSAVALFLLLCLTHPSLLVAQSREYSDAPAAQHQLRDLFGHKKCVLASVDTSHGLASEVVKLHSLLKSTHRQDELFFGFLVANSGEVAVMREAVDQCSLNINYSIKVMKTFPPFILDIFRSDVYRKPPSSWYHAGVFGNFLLPEAFPECDYFVYLDNDMFMNIDIVSEVFEKVKLTRKEKKTGQMVPTNVGFLFETCEQSGRIRFGQFNNSHPYVRQMGVRYINPYKYINNGIWLVNASSWRAERVTEALWAAVQLAQTEPIFLAGNRRVNRRPDDQHVNFLVQGAKATHLPPHLNIRKNCEQRAQRFLSSTSSKHRSQGIIHLAGGAKTCSAPFPSQPMALMTSVVHSLSRHCNISPRLLADCSATSQRLHARNVSFVDTGLGAFHFPPAGEFTHLPHPVAKGLL